MPTRIPRKARASVQLVGAGPAVKAAPPGDPAKPAPAPRARFARPTSSAVLGSPSPAARRTGDCETGRGTELPAHPRAHEVLKDLRSGKYAIQDELDLHGMTANEARAPCKHS